MYIKREDAIKAIAEYFSDDDDSHWNAIATYIIKDIPTVEPTIEIDADTVKKLVSEGWTTVLETKQGEWIEKAVSIIDDMQSEGVVDYEQAREFRMRARMKGADDE